MLFLHSSFLACNSYDCIAPYVDIILHRGRFWAKSAALESIRWCCFRSYWTVLSHVMRGQPSCLLQSARGEANRILLASALSSMRIICPNRVSRRDWIIAVSLGCFVASTGEHQTTTFHSKSDARPPWQTNQQYDYISGRLRVRTCRKPKIFSDAVF